MKCEEIKICLPEYIDGKLDSKATAKVENHIQNCSSCNELYNELNSFLKFTDTIPNINPPKGMKDDFMHEVEMELDSKKIVFPTFWIKVAASVIITLGIFGTGYFTGTKNGKISQLETELSSLKQEVLLAGLNNYSGPQKLDAVYAIKTMGNADESVVNALIQTMNSDQNINVRLAAISALAEMMDKNQTIKPALVNSLLLQNNPLLQISLIQILTESGVTEAKENIQTISTDENTNEQVKEYARNMIKTII